MKRPTTLNIDDDIRGMLDQIATREERSRSWIADRLIREGLAARGQQPPAIAQGAHQPAAAAAHMENADG